MEGFKFQIGEIVKHRLCDKNRLLILEQYAQFCYGGLRENLYLCVFGTGKGSYSIAEFEPEKRFKFSEIELERVE